MRLLKSFQQEDINNAVQAKFAMVAPVIEATLYSVAVDRIERLGGYTEWTLHDLAREVREGAGDAGICFEWAVHDAIADRNPLIWPLASEVLTDYCGIEDGADSILFGPEKNGRIPIIESVQDALTDESRVYVGNRGQPAKLRRYIPQIVNAFYRHELRNSLPRSINGLWKADLFLGNAGVDRWVGTTVKSNAPDLEAAQGLRIGIYPKVNVRDVPRRDEQLNLIRLPLPYDAGFMELYYKAFFLVRAFLKADATVPPAANLPDAEDRFIAQELAVRRDYPLLEVVAAIRDMGQEHLLDTRDVESVTPTAALSTDAGLEQDPIPGLESSESVSLSPEALPTE
jgi:hypothetical protein